MLAAALVIFTLDEFGVMYWTSSEKVILGIGAIGIIMLMLIETARKEWHRIGMVAFFVYAAFAYTRLKTGLYVEIPRMEVIRNMAIFTPIFYVVKWLFTKF